MLLTAANTRKPTFWGASCTNQTVEARDKAGGRTVNNYRVCRKVGEGSSGKVYKVENFQTGDIFAMKVCTRTDRLENLSLPMNNVEACVEGEIGFRLSTPRNFTTCT